VSAVWDLLVVGAGPAGLSAALAASRAGAQVLVVEEQPAPGGHLALEATAARGPAGVARVALLVGQAVAAGATLRCGVVVQTLEASDEGFGALLSGALGTATIRARRVVVASGARELPCAFPGWTRPGVLLARAAQRLVVQDWLLPGERVVVYGAAGATCARELAAAGAQVVWLDPRRGARPVPPGVERRAGWRVVAAQGRERVEAVEAALGPSGPRETIPAEALCLALGLAPAPELAWQAGAQFAWQDVGHVVRRGPGGETTVPGLYVAGDAVWPRGTAWALADGRRVGLAAAGVAPSDRRTEPAPRRPALPPLVSGPADLVVCRCEEVTLGDAQAAIAAGARTLDTLKRRTRAGMGPCQGRWCYPLLAALLMEARADPATLQPPYLRLPLRPLPLPQLAGGGT
jgi:thioredoxin reductase/bacterioferritin-associated ferredoxin